MFPFVRPKPDRRKSPPDPHILAERLRHMVTKARRGELLVPEDWNAVYDAACVLESLAPPEPDALRDQNQGSC